MGRFGRDDTPSELRAALNGLRVIPPLGEMSGYEFWDDPDDVLDQLPQPGAAASWAVHIHYASASGEQSQRTITCKRMVGNLGGGVTVLAHCHLRNQPRSFTLGNMLAIVDISSGEIFEPYAYFDRLRVEGLPFSNEGLATFARICTFLSRCDGHEHPEEWREIEHGLERYALRFGGDDRDLEQAIASCKALAPDDKDFVKCLGAVQRSANGPKLARLAIETSGRIIDADGKHAAEEVRWAVHVGDALKRIAVRDN